MKLLSGRLCEEKQEVRDKILGALTGAGCGAMQTKWNILKDLM